MSEGSYIPLAVGEGYFSDWQSPISADDGKTWVWNHAQQKYVPQALSAGVTDHALLTHLDFASSGHTGFEAAGAGVAAVAAHVALADPHSQYLLESAYTAADVFAKVLTQDGSGSGLDADLLDGNSSAAFATAGHSHTIAHSSLTGLSNDDHAQYLLASGSRNGAATIVASSASNTPLTLKLAASQTADGLRVVDSANGQLLHINQYGWLGVGADAANIYDYTFGYGSIRLIDANLSIANARSLFSIPNWYALGFSVTQDDQSAVASYGGLTAGFTGYVIIAGTNTVKPDYVYGSDVFVEADSDIGVDAIGSNLSVYTYANATNLSGIALFVENSGSGTVTTARGINLISPYTTSSTYTTYIGIDIGSVATLSGATNKYAIRTQGGQVLHQTGAAATVGLVVQGAASQSADLTQWKNSSGTVLSAITKDGTIKTVNGKAWDLRGYTTTAPAATGYVTVTIDGATYKLLASNV